MSLVAVRDVQEFDRIVEGREAPVVVGFFGDFSAVSRRAEGAFRTFADKNREQLTLFVDVGSIKGIHKRFGVRSVPTVIALEAGKITQKVVGEQEPDFYTRALLEHAAMASGKGKDGVSFPPVTVWVSDTCPWCTRVKSYLRKRRVPFREVNVSQNPSEAASLQARTGQTGVPQVSIGGRYVVGFDRPRIDEYLGLSPDPSAA